MGKNTRNVHPGFSGMFRLEKKLGMFILNSWECKKTPRNVPTSQNPGNVGVIKIGNVHPRVLGIRKKRECSSQIPGNAGIGKTGMFEHPGFLGMEKNPRNAHHGFLGMFRLEKNWECSSWIAGNAGVGKNLGMFISDSWECKNTQECLNIPDSWECIKNPRNVHPGFLGILGV